MKIVLKRGKEMSGEQDLQLILKQKTENDVAIVINMNQKINHFGITLSDQEAKEIVLQRNESLKKHGRVEFGEGILSKLIFEFCDSKYIENDQFADTISKLTDIFYRFQNRSGDTLSDDEMLHFMKEQFEGVCRGDLEYLEQTVIPAYIQKLRDGHADYRAKDGYGEYTDLDEELQWKDSLYIEALRDLE